MRDLKTCQPSNFQPKIRLAYFQDSRLYQNLGLRLRNMELEKFSFSSMSITALQYAANIISTRVTISLYLRMKQNTTKEPSL
jgi:hypothetical protein